MHTHDQDAVRKGERGELLLCAWFKANGLGFLHVNNAPEFFATLFHDAVKRPDFLLLFDSIGLVAVDVKYKELWKNHEYSLDLESEVKRVIGFERLFRIPFWYAYCADEGACWYWISALRALEVGVERQGAQGSFLALKRRDLERVQTASDLGKLYTARLVAPRKAFDRLDKEHGPRAGSPRTRTRGS